MGIAVRKGETVRCAHGNWTNNPTSYTYQWQRAGVDIEGATAATYVAVDADVGRTLDCVVTAHNAAGDSPPKTSNISDPVTGTTQTITLGVAHETTTAAAASITSALLPLADMTFAANTDPRAGSFGAVQRNIGHDVESLAINDAGTYIACGERYNEAIMYPQLFSTSTGEQRGCKVELYFNRPYQVVSGSSDIAKGVKQVAIDATKIYANIGPDIIHFPIATLVAGDGGDSVWYAPPARQLIAGAQGNTSVNTRWIMGLAVRESDGKLFAAESGPDGMQDGSTGTLSPATALVWQLPTSQFTGGNATNPTPSVVATTEGSWTIPNVRKLEVDRQGYVWALQQASIANSRAAILSRWEVTGSGGSFAATRVGAYALPSGVYPMDLCCDPSSDTIVVSDNGQDQNYKKYTYTGFSEGNPVLSAAGTIGVQYGYLDTTTGTKGTLGTRRFCGPYGIAIDSSGNIYTSETFRPKAGDAGWGDVNESGCQIMKQDSSGTQQWRNYCHGLMRTVCPTADGTRAYGPWRAYTRQNSDTAPPFWNKSPNSFSPNNSEYILTSYLHDPWSYPSDWLNYPAWVDRASAYTIDANSSRYLIVRSVGFNSNITYIYAQVDGTDNFRPAVSVGNTTIVTDDSSASTGQYLDIMSSWVDDSMNLWIAGGAVAVFRFRVQGYNGNGSPLYDSSHVDSFALPPPYVGSRVSRIEVHGTDIWVSGWPNTNIGFGSPDQAYSGLAYFSIGRTIMKYAGGVTYLDAHGGSWPASPTWTYVDSFDATSDGSGGSNSYKWYPTAFGAESGARVCIGYQGSTGGGLTFIDDADGTVSSLMDTPLSAIGWGRNSGIDMQDGIFCRNGYAWVENSWANYQYAFKLSTV